MIRWLRLEKLSDSTNEESDEVEVHAEDNFAQTLKKSNVSYLHSSGTEVCISKGNPLV